MRIVFLAVDDVFAGLMQKYVYARHPEWIVASVISTSLVYRKSSLGALVFLLRKSGLVYVLQMIRMKIVRTVFARGEKILPTVLARKNGVEEYHTSDLNTDESIARLRSWKPDLLISTNFSQYVGKQAREIPVVGAWNLHKSFLPHYRGMAPSFYALLEGAESVGVTLHVLAKGFDTGDILTQSKIPIEPGDTVYRLNKRTADVGGSLLADFLEDLNPNGVQATPQPQGNWRSYSYPTRADLRAFRRKGCRF